MLPQNNSLIKNDLLHANSHESESIGIDDLYIAVVIVDFKQPNNNLNALYYVS